MTSDVLVTIVNVKTRIYIFRFIILVDKIKEKNVFDNISNVTFLPYI